MFNVKTVVMVEKWKGHMLSASGGRFDERPDKRQYSSKIYIFVFIFLCNYVESDMYTFRYICQSLVGKLTGLTSVRKVAKYVFYVLMFLCLSVHVS